MTTPTSAIDERRHISARDVVAGFMLLINIGALVWGAATLSSTVGELGRTTVRLGNTVDRIDSRVYSQEARIQVLEDRTAGARNGR